MPAAIPSIAAFAASSAIAAVTVDIVTAILINVALGALEFQDENGCTWVALDE